jgi:hypothetical protein
VEVRVLFGALSEGPARRSFSSGRGAVAIPSRRLEQLPHDADQRPCHRKRVPPRVRVLARRALVLAVVVLQLGLIVRGYWSDHKEFAFQMFPESSTWRAEVVRVTATGRRIPIEHPWSGYRWDDLVPSRGLRFPSIRHHADAGLANQLAFLEAALEWVAANTPRDRETRYLEATVTSWHNADRPRVQVLRSRLRGAAG